MFALAAGGFAASSSNCAQLAFSPDAVERISTCGMKNFVSLTLTKTKQYKTILEVFTYFLTYLVSNTLRTVKKKKE